MTHPLKKLIADNFDNVATFASEAGVSSATVYRLLKGQGWFSLEALQRISAATGGQFSILDLVTGWHEMWSKRADNKSDAEKTTKKQLVGEGV